MQALKPTALYPYKDISIDLTVESIRRSIAEYEASPKCRWCGEATRCPNAMCSEECIAAYVAAQHDGQRCDWIEDGDCSICNEFGNYYGPDGLMQAEAPAYPVSGMAMTIDADEEAA